MLYLFFIILHVVYFINKPARVLVPKKHIRNFHYPKPLTYGFCMRQVFAIDRHLRAFFWSRYRECAIVHMTISVSLMYVSYVFVNTC